MPELMPRSSSALPCCRLMRCDYLVTHDPVKPREARERRAGGAGAAGGGAPRAPPAAGRLRQVVGGLAVELLVETGDLHLARHVDCRYQIDHLDDREAHAEGVGHGDRHADELEA